MDHEPQTKQNCGVYTQKLPPLMVSGLPPLSNERRCGRNKQIEEKGKNRLIIVRGDELHKLNWLF
jgi:hypothetical protein